MLSVDEEEEEEMRPNVQCMPLQWFAYLILQYGTSDRYPRREDAVALGVPYTEKHLRLAFGKHRRGKSLQITNVTLDRIQVALVFGSSTEDDMQWACVVWWYS